MPLPPPVPRDELHLRRIEIRGYRRHDGLYDIEARITDTKSNDLQLSEKMVPAGERIHDMWLRLTVDEALTGWTNTAVRSRSTAATPTPPTARSRCAAGRSFR